MIIISYLKTCNGLKRKVILALDKQVTISKNFWTNSLELSTLCLPSNFLQSSQTESSGSDQIPQVKQWWTY